MQESDYMARKAQTILYQKYPTNSGTHLVQTVKHEIL